MNFRYAKPLLSRRAFCTSALSSSALSIPALCGPLFGCAASREKEARETASPPGEYRGPLVDPKKIPGNFMWQQRVSATHGGRKGAFDAVVQKNDGELLVLGLTPMNTRGFSLTQRGTEFEYKQFVPFELPFSPASVLYDIHRAFFYNLLEDFPASGTRHSAFAGEALSDEFSQGRLMTRLFENVSGTAEHLKIEYSLPGYCQGVPPRITSIDNRAFGYQLQVKTTSVHAL